LAYLSFKKTALQSTIGVDGILPEKVGCLPWITSEVAQTKLRISSVEQYELYVLSEYTLNISYYKLCLG
jgi:hypothetical protein